MQIEQWRIARYQSSNVLAIGQWKNGKAPDIMRLMPLPGDPTAASKMITISDEEMARRKYKIKKAYKAKLTPHFEALVREHWAPDWGPHPDELVKKKAAVQDA